MAISLKQKTPHPFEARGWSLRRSAQTQGPHLVGLTRQIGQWILSDFFIVRSNKKTRASAARASPSP